MFVHGSESRIGWVGEPSNPNRIYNSTQCSPLFSGWVLRFVFFLIILKNRIYPQYMLHEQQKNS